MFWVDCIEQKAKIALDNRARGKKPSFLCEMEHNLEDVDMSRALTKQSRLHRLFG